MVRFQTIERRSDVESFDDRTHFSTKNLQTNKHTRKQTRQSQHARLHGLAGLLSHAVADSNAAAQEHALDAACAYLAVTDESTASRLAPVLCPAIAKKCLNGRPRTVEKATEAFMLCAELEASEPAVEALLKAATTNKVPKVVLAAANSLLTLVSSFGSPTVDAKPLLKGMTPLFEAKDSKVRDTAKQLVVELARWVGSGVVTSLLIDQMRDTMRKEMEEALKDIGSGGKPVPTRLTRKRQAAAAAATPGRSSQPASPGASGASGASGESGPPPLPPSPAAPEIDTFDLSEPQSILKELKDDVFWTPLSAAKWSERRDALLHLKKLASVPRLAGGEYGDVSRALAKIIKNDSNVVCVAESLNCAAALGRGLRREFAGNARSFTSICLMKLKDKSGAVVNASLDALATFGAHCFLLSDVMEDVIEHFKACKVPKAKSGALGWLAECASNSKDPRKVKDLVKVFKEFEKTLASLAADADASVRDAALGCSVAFSLAGPECKSLVEKFAGKLDDKQRKKFEALAAGEDIETAAPSRSSSAPPQRPATAAAAPISRPLARPASAAPRRPVTSAGARPRTAGASRGAPSSPTKAEPQDAPLPTTEIAEERVGELLGTSHIAGLASSDWKVRLAAVTAHKEAIEAKTASISSPPDTDSSAFDASNTEALIVFACSRPSIDKENNFQVIKASVEMMSAVVLGSAFITKSLAHHAILACTAKLSDTKLNVPTSELFLNLAECTSPTFVVKQVFQAGGSEVAKKNPKLLSEILRFLTASMLAFGATAAPSPRAVDLKVVLGMCKTSLNAAASPLVKNAAMEAIGCANTFLGNAGTLAVLNAAPGDELKSALLSNIENECNKNPLSEHPHEPERKVRGATKPKAKPSAAAGAAAPSGDSDEPEVLLIDGADGPRVDITSRITQKLIKDLYSNNWKERNAALQALEGIIAETKLPGCGGAALEPGVLSDLFSALKGRLSDSNKNLVALALNVLGKLGAALGPALLRSIGTMLPSILSTFNDNRKATRDAATTCLTTWIDSGRSEVLDKMLHGSSAMRNYVTDTKSSPDGKVDVLHMLKGYADESAMRSYLKKVADAAAGDKSAAVRAASADLSNAVDSMPAVAGSPAKASGESNASSFSDRPATAVVSPRPAAAVVSPRPATAASSVTSRPVTIEASASSGEDEEAVFRVSAGAAAAREDRLRRVPRRLKFDDGPRTSDLYDAVYDAMSGNLRGDVLEMLRSSDFKVLCRGVDAVLAEVQSSPGHMAHLQTVDVWFRWISLKLCEGNTTVILKVLELASALVESVGAIDGGLVDQDLSLLLPTVVEKRGHNQDRIRQLHRELLQLICSKLPTSKVMTYILDGLKSKNNRTRIECADDVAILADEAYAIGTEVSPPGGDEVLTFLNHRALAGSSISEVLTTSFESTKKATQSLVLLAGERDASLRGSVMGAIAAIYRCVGQDVVWKFVGHIPDAHRSLLADKFKWEDKQLEKSGMPKAGAMLHGPGGKVEKERPSTASAGRSRPSSAARSSPMRASAPELPTGGAMPALAPVATELASPARTPVAPEEGMAPVTPYKVHPSMVAPPAEADVAEQWRRGCTAASDHEEAASVEGMKLLCTLLAHASGGRLTDSGIEAVVDGADTAAAGLADNADVALGRAAAGGSTRGAKYTVNTLMMLFNIPRCARAVSQPVLERVMANLLVRLLDDRLPRLSEGPQLLKALNILMLRVLESSDRTKAFSVLLLLLRVPPSRLSSTRVIDDGLGGLTDGDAQTKKFLELVVKCLIKLTKALSESISMIDVDKLVHAIHGFFAGLGVDELRRRGSTDDKPLRMVKTVLHELCKTLGYKVRHHMSLVPIAERPTPIILAYIDLNLSSLASAGHTIAVDPNAVDASVASSSSSSSVATLSARPATAGASPSDLKSQLASIFKQIGDKSTTSAGLEALYRFTKRHPSVDIHPHLAKTSDAFRAYIQRGLAKCASNDMELEKENAGQRIGAAPQMAARGGGSGAAGGPAPTPATKAVEQVEAMSRRFRDFRQQMAAPAAPAPTSSAASAAGSNLEDIKRRFESIQAKAQTIQGSADTGRPTTADAGGSNLANLRARLNELKTTNDRS